MGTTSSRDCSGIERMFDNGYTTIWSREGLGAPLGQAATHADTCCTVVHSLQAVQVHTSPTFKLRRGEEKANLAGFVLAPNESPHSGVQRKNTRSGNKLSGTVPPNEHFHSPSEDIPIPDLVEVMALKARLESQRSSLTGRAA